MAKTIIVPGRGAVKVNNSFESGVLWPSQWPSSSGHKETPYERTRRQVYATGNKWAIENFHATHD